MLDIFHIVGFVAAIASYTFLQTTGKVDPTSAQAMLGLASFLAGSYVRGSAPPLNQAVNTTGIQK